MLYMTVTETAEKWGVSPRQVQRLVALDRIPGAQKLGKAWVIPRDTDKPADWRREKRLPSNPPDLLSADLIRVLDATTLPMPAANPDAILDAMEEERLRLIYAAELAYLRGDFAQTMACFQATAGDDAARLRLCPVAIAAAISLGDYHAYTGIEGYLKSCLEKGTGGDAAAAIAEIALATAAVSVVANNMVPDWLAAGDFGALPPQSKPDALYLRARHLNNTGRLDAMLAVAQTALTLSSPEMGVTITELYLRLTCAMACHGLERETESRDWLLSSMRRGLPHGFVTPFAELVTAFGGLMEQCLEQEFPGYYRAVIEQWQRTWKNWITFHNQFTKDNITLILTLREFHLATLVARRVPYAKIASQYGISVGRLKNIMLGIYGKLFISSRDELAKYVF